MVHGGELVDDLDRGQVHGGDLGVGDSQEMVVEGELHVPLGPWASHHAHFHLDPGHVGHVGTDQPAGQVPLLEVDEMSFEEEPAGEAAFEAPPELEITDGPPEDEPGDE